MSRGRPEGRAHRQRLREEVLPHLMRGSQVPLAKTLAAMLSVSVSEAARHMRRVLAEDGFVVAVRAPSQNKGVFVVSVPILSPKCSETSNPRQSDKLQMALPS